MGRQLFPIDIVAPGSRGVNFEEQNSLLDPGWATKAENAVIDENGRLAARGGYSDETGTAISSTPDIESLFEYIQEDGTTEMIVAWAGGIGNSLDDPEGNDISGSVTDTDGIWWFQNYDDECWGFQDGQKPIVYTGSGTFATVSESAGTAPTIADYVGLCAYGRVWGLDSDKQTIKYSSLLDGTEWSGGSSGSIDMSNIWTEGTDQVTALAAFNGLLMAFGHNHIVIWEDTTGTALGLNPANMIVRDVITGTGCESQWSIQPLGKSDLLFLSKHGVQSLSRVIIQKSAPLGTLSMKVQTELLNDLFNTANLEEIRSAVNPNAGFYVLTFPSRSRSFVFFYRRPFVDRQEGRQLYPITTWTLAPTAWEYRESTNKLLLGYAGNIGEYDGSVTDAGTEFTFTYESGWLTLGGQAEDLIKIFKRFGSIIFTLGAISVRYKWDFDFRGQFTFKTVEYASPGTAEWGEAEWGEDEWSGAVTLQIKRFPASGSGQYIKIGLDVDIDSSFAIQQLEIMAKLGRYS